MLQGSCLCGQVVYTSRANCRSVGLLPLFLQIYHVKDEQPDIITLKVGLLDNSQDLADLPHKHIHQDPDWAWLSEE